ncbi:MAG TPA: hypothetical protein VGJ20_20645 [Xanthobacteraceae bacterium]|jgi:hypothetical protein
MSLSFPVSPALNQTYQQFIWDGTAWQPNLQAKFVTSVNGMVGDVSLSGSRVLINKTVISTPIVSVSFFAGFDGSYDELELHMLDLLPASENSIWVRCSLDGSTFDASALYQYAQTSYTTVGTGALSGGASQTAAVVSGFIGVAAGYGMYEVMSIRLPPSSARVHGVWQQSSINSGNNYGTSGKWDYAGATPIKGLQLQFNGAPNITHGSFILYGIKK